MSGPPSTFEEAGNMFLTDTTLIHNWAHGNAAAVVETESGPLRSPANLMAEAEENLGGLAVAVESASTSAEAAAGYEAGAAAARDAAMALARMDVSFALAVALSTDTTGPNAFFSVPKGGLGQDGVTPLARTTCYRRTGTSTAVAFSTILSGDEFDNYVGPSPGQSLQLFESVDPSIDGQALLVGVDGRPNSPAPLSSFLGSLHYETTDVVAPDEMWVVDVRGALVLKLGTAGTDAAITAIQTAIAALTGRVNRSLFASGDLRSPNANLSRLRQTRMRLGIISEGGVAQMVYGLGGDSYSQRADRFVRRYAKRLQEKYGFAGVGWIGFGWAGGGSGPWTAGSQPGTRDLTARTDIVTVQEVIGSWTCTYNSPSTNTPSMSLAISSTPGDYHRFTIPAGHNAAQLFYGGDGTGVISVSWDDGATYGPNIALTTVGAANIALTGIPSTAAIARIKVVGGNVALAGVDLRSAAPGIRVHKLAGSGSGAVQWAQLGTKWGEQLAALGLHRFQVMLGPNDQAVPRTAAQFAADITAIMTRVATALPSADRLVAMPPENNRTTNAVAMTAYSEATRNAVAAMDVAFTDTQDSLGPPDNYGYAYAWANPNNPLFASDLLHPYVDGSGNSAGGSAIAEHLFRVDSCLL